MEAAKLSVFYSDLWRNYAYRPVNLKTVVAATFHNMQPRSGDNIRDFTAINMWYERREKRYNLSLGGNILGLMTADSLAHLAMLDPPYLKAFNKPIQYCLNDEKCADMANLIGKTTIDLVKTF